MARTYPVRIAVVDAHAVVRHGVARILECEATFEVAGEAATAAEARALVRRERPDLVLLGLNLEDADALEVIGSLAGEECGPRILVLSVYDPKIFAERCLRRGAAGYVGKDAEIDELRSAVRTVLAGEVFVGEEVHRQILSRLARGGSGLEDSPIQSLTDREFQVLRLLGKGRTTREIAGLLDLSVKTIETHRAKLMKKLGLENATQLLHRAITWIRSEEAGE